MSTTETIRVATNLQQLMKMAAKEMQAPVIALGFDMADNALRRIAQRAIDLGDSILIEELKAISYIREE
jgi:hypothetical protein